MAKNSIQDKNLDNLFKGILALESINECYAFFEDLCTINELIALKQRFHVAYLVKQEKTYQEIAAATGASTATISRVRRALEYGSDGYNIIIDRLVDSSELNNK